MANTWKQPSGRDERPGIQRVDSYRFDSHRGQGVESADSQPDDSQLNLFEILPADSAGTRRLAVARGRDNAGSSRLDLPVVETLSSEPFSAQRGNPDVAPSGATDSDGVELIRGAGAARAIPDAGVSDADDLRRIEESIRWLMSAGAAPMPRAASLPPVLGLPPLDARSDDSLLLDPETLFPPRPQRRSNLAAGAAKFLLVSAVAAPTAYFIASWMQFPGAVTTSDPATVSPVPTPVALSEDPAAATTRTVSAPATQTMPATKVASATSLPVSDAVPAPPPQTTHRDETAKAPPPDSPPPATGVAALAVADVSGVTTAPPAPEPPPVVTASPVVAPSPAVTPPPTVTPPPAAPPSAETTTPPPAPAPARPALHSEEIAMMVERGRVLFESGDLAAARLFFRRAADAGDAAAAIAMGATYDPEVLAQRFIRGIEADPAEAQRWYERAREMGQQRMLAQGH